MNIFDPYPDSVEVDGHKYEVNLSFDRVLMAMDCATDKLLTDVDKIGAQVELLIVSPPPDLRTQVEILTAIYKLFPRGGGEKVMDFHQDAALIRTAFLRGYGIDLTRERPHFLQFLEMLADLPRDTAFMRTVELRMRPVPELTKHNKKEVTALLEAKSKVALQLSEEERAARWQKSLQNFAKKIGGV